MNLGGTKVINSCINMWKPPHLGQSLHMQLLKHEIAEGLFVLARTNTSICDQVIAWQGFQIKGFSYFFKCACARASVHAWAYVCENRPTRVSANNFVGMMATLSALFAVKLPLQFNCSGRLAEYFLQYFRIFCLQWEHIYAVLCTVHTWKTV